MSTRLAELIPEAVALDAARRVLTAAQQLYSQLQPGVDVRIGRDTDEALQATQVYLSVVDLVAWAQRGEGQPEEVPDLLLSVASTLAVCPIGVRREVDVTPAELVSEFDEDDALSLCCVAGWARLQLAQGQRLNTDQLAALAGLSSTQVRTLSRAGELRSATEPTKKGGTEYLAKECRRFLGARGVPGFGS